MSLSIPPSNSIVQVALFLASGPVRSVERVEHHARHVERREQGRGRAHPPQDVEADGLVSAGKGHCQDLILREEAREREDPGNPDFSASGIPKVVGGVDEATGSAASGTRTYRAFEAAPLKAKLESLTIDGGAARR